LILLQDKSGVYDIRIVMLHDFRAKVTYIILCHARSIGNMIDLRKTDHIKTFGNSMYPLLHDGDILYYQKSPFNEIKIDDIILFKKKDRYITHRVICRKNDYVVTKGDNVLKSDGKIFQNAIVGKVNKIKRNDTFFDLKNLYLIQSTIYLRELSHMFAELSQKKMPFVVLKGLPLVQYYFNSIPERLYADCDILTEKSHEKQFNEIFCRHLYKKHKKELVRENIHEGKHIYEENYYKFIHNVPVSIDVHLEAVFTFTRDDFSY
jgi:signal peptidase I